MKQRNKHQLKNFFKEVFNFQLTDTQLFVIASIITDSELNQSKILNHLIKITNKIENHLEITDTQLDTSLIAILMELRRIALIIENQMPVEIILN